MDSKNLILKYLNDTYSIRKILESFAPLNPEESGTGVSVLAPWSVGSISANTSIPGSEVLEELENVPGVTVQEKSIDGVGVTLVEMGESLGVQAHRSHESFRITDLPVKQVMNLHVYQFVLQKVQENDKPVKIEEAIFDLKNNAFLPDDFMPEHLMGMVEGELSLTASEILKAYEINPGLKILYLYHEQKNGSQGRVRFLYPAKVNIEGELPGNDGIREKLTSSFAGLSANQKYRDFEHSRLLKSVIYNIESRNSRELKRPVFDSRKVSALQEMGLAEKTGDVARVKDTVTLDEIKERYAELRKHGEELSREWLEYSLKLAD